MSLINFLFIFISSFVLTLIIRKYALKKSLLDIPNSRSSHTLPTPRGGGLAIVISFLVGGAVYLFGYENSSSSIIALLVASFVIALIGWIDDHGHVDAKYRLLIHFVVAVAVVFLVLSEFNVSDVNILLQFKIIFGCAFAIWVIWLLNLFNFMDGIDGIASVEAITILAITSYCHWYMVPASSFINIYWILGVSILGFLLWNFPPAKIFMGDVGSGFIGFALGIIMLVASTENENMFWIWGIMLGCFVVDATVTLLRRVFLRENIFQAHRSHAYQNASRKFNSHLKVTMAVAFLNLFWLAPIACSVAFGLIEGYVGLLISYTPLIMISLVLKAGLPEDNL